LAIPKLPFGACRALSLLGVFAPTMAKRLEDIDAIGLGLGVTEMDGRAADEARALWTWVKQMDNQR
jgi:hypothetical protein